MMTQPLILHREKAAAIANAVRTHVETAAPGEFFSLKKAQVSHTVPRPDDPNLNDGKIDITSLTEIISIDPENRICVAEAGVTFEKLVAGTMKYGLIPRTVSELKTITIGGAVAGCSVESMSYKYGGFHDGCLEYEIITGNGDIVTCGRDSNPDIFEMVHGTFGTVGILSLLTFSLVSAERYVKVEYRKYDSFAGLMESVRRHYEARDLDFMDAIVHSPSECILCAGTFTAEAPYAHEYFITPYYRSTRKYRIDYLKTEDYLFRYDSDCHWIIRNFGLENPILRRLAAPFALGSSNILSLARRYPILNTIRPKPDVIADVFIPWARIENFFAWYRETFEYYPLWIVPYRIETMYPWVNPALMQPDGEKLYIDCAIYGFRQSGEKNYYRLLEEKVAELGGLKTLITHNFYTQEEFWASYDRPAYEAVKMKTDPRGTFRDLYSKTNWHGTRPAVRPAGASRVRSSRPILRPESGG